jgi:ATP-dependent RNA helicase DeaD
MSDQFQKFNLSTEMLRGLEKMGFTTPTPVQEAAIEPMKARHDLLVQAPTGTGKTGAFGIPTVEAIDPNNQNIQAIILCPTRELAVQTERVIKNFSAYKQGVRTLALYGGEPIYKQITALRKKPQIIVATPGRMIDHMNRRTAKYNHVNLVVMDEADRMLDMGFRDDMNMILEKVPTNRQTVLFSATVSNEIKKLAEEYQTDSKHIHIQTEPSEVTHVEQFCTEVQQGAKTPTLLRLLKENTFAQVLVFVGTKLMADTLTQDLNQNGYRSDVLHGGLKQSQREKVMRRYRTGQVNILVATDVAARGIDVSNIDAVINYDIPGDSDSYTHRIGRTGRANQSGVAHTLLYRKERWKLEAIIKETRASIQPTESTGKIDLSDWKHDKPSGRTGGRNQKPWQQKLQQKDTRNAFSRGRKKRSKVGA